MVRRFQLMEPERGLRPRLAHATARLRDGLLRDNKVIPAVLGALALIVFAWILAGALIDDPSGGGRQVANQSNQPNQPSQQQQVAQNPDQAQGTPETPAPSVENRDAESYAAFEQKDPFRELFQPPGTEDPAAGTDQYDDGSTDDGTGDGTGDGTDVGAGDGTGDGSGGEDFIDQTFPDDGSGSGGGAGNGSGSGDGSGGGRGSGGGDDGLFDSGGELFDSGGNNVAP